jgi:hypothetical protein
MMPAYKHIRMKTKKLLTIEMLMFLIVASIGALILFTNHSTVQAQVPNQGLTQTVSWTSATPANTVFSINTIGFSNVTVSFHVFFQTITGGSVVFRAIDNPTGAPGPTPSFTILQCTSIGSNGALGTSLNSSSTFSLATGNGAFSCPVLGMFSLQILLNTAITSGVGATEVINATPTNIPSAPNTVLSIPGATSAFNLASSPVSNVISSSSSPFDNGGTPVSNPVTVKSSQGNLYGWFITNTSTSLCYLQLFNVAAPTLGTTVPVLSLGVPGGTGATELSVEQSLSIPIGFSTAISVAGSTTQGATGATACTLAVNLWFL